MKWLAKSNWSLTLANKWVCLSDKDRGDILSLIEGKKEYKSLANKIRNSNKRITVSSAKGKGRGLQQWVCSRISGIIGEEYKQSDDSCLIHSREMGQAGVDIILRGDALKKFPFSIECKSTESINVRQFIDQAKSNQREGTDWMVVCRTKSIPETIVMISWDVFEKLVRREL